MPDRATRLVGLHDPDAHPICKGRIDQATDNDDGLILDYCVEYGAAPDGRTHLKSEISPPNFQVEVAKTPSLRPI